MWVYSRNMKVFFVSICLVVISLLGPNSFSDNIFRNPLILRNLLRSEQKVLIYTSIIRTSQLLNEHLSQIIIADTSHTIPNSSVHTSALGNILRPARWSLFPRVVVSAFLPWLGDRVPVDL